MGVQRPHLRRAKVGPEYGAWKEFVDDLKQTQTPYCELRGDAPWSDEELEFADAEGFETTLFNGVLEADDAVVIVESGRGETQHELAKRLETFLKDNEVLDERDDGGVACGRC